MTQQLGSLGLDRRDIDNACDKCSVAQWFYIVHTRNGGEVRLCHHHYNAHLSYIVGQGYSVTDETHRLNERPSISANAE